MGIIFFNVPEARSHLLKHGLVFTLRKKRSTGKTTAVVGSLYNHISIARVLVELVAPIPAVDESYPFGQVVKNLSPYISQSGFSDLKSWFERAVKHYKKPVSLYLFKVTLLEKLKEEHEIDEFLQRKSVHPSRKNH